ncbi:hypothetical protein WJX74_002032 [Apatococcus lobatus]|uniref:Uncharacterized protein n=1 Tax=Apatococcus lobatus TaxID=904363 RepID=A0AAW1Q5N9_9CHLO
MVPGEEDDLQADLCMKTLLRQSGLIPSGLQDVQSALNEQKDMFTILGTSRRLLIMAKSGLGTFDHGPRPLSASKAAMLSCKAFRNPGHEVHLAAEAREKVFKAAQVDAEAHDVNPFTKQLYEDEPEVVPKMASDFQRGSTRSTLPSMQMMKHGTGLLRWAQQCQCNSH